MEDRILTYLSRRGARPEHVADHLGVSADELRPVLDDMERKGWISVAAVWYGNDPTSSSTINVLLLTPAGRQEAEKHQRDSAEEDEPVVLTRDELVTELQRRLGWTDEQIAMNPTLRGDRFHFWPSISAWSRLPD